MITKAQMINPDNREFHHVSLTQSGHPKPVCYRVRRNGRTQIWKTRPDEFKMPYKWGLYGHGYITHNDADSWYLASECPRCNTKVGPITYPNMYLFLTNLGVTEAAAVNYLEAALQFDTVNIFVAGELAGLIRMGYGQSENGLHVWLTYTYLSVEDSEF